MYLKGTTLNKETNNKTISKIERAQEWLLVLGIMGAVASWWWAIVY